MLVFGVVTLRDHPKFRLRKQSALTRSLDLPTRTSSERQAEMVFQLWMFVLIKGGGASQFSRHYIYTYIPTHIIILLAIVRIPGNQPRFEDFMYHGFLLWSCVEVVSILFVMELETVETWSTWADQGPGFVLNDRCIWRLQTPNTIETPTSNPNITRIDDFGSS